MEILFEELKGKTHSIGLITLNRPQVLNSLNHSMIRSLYSQLQIWETAQHVKAVIIRAAEGRAFCAGGDIRSIYEKMKTNDPCTPDFFRDEYQLNQKIYHYPKPYIALLNGITMGGGVGISLHGSYCIASDKLSFAMPETGIGFFPDVGGTYFLPRISSHIGYYLGLTGAKITSDDCVQLGLVNQKVSEESLPDIIHELTHQALSGETYSAVSKIIEQFRINSGPSFLMGHKEEINRCFQANSVEEIIKLLQASENDFCKHALDNLSKKSPASLKVTLRALQEGARLDFDHCMNQEYRLVNRFLKSHDFREGIRALIIEKDQQPKWQPEALSAVNDQMVDAYFAPLETELI